MISVIRKEMPVSATLEASATKNRMIQQLTSIVTCCAMLLGMFMFMTVSTAFCSNTTAGDNIQNAVNDGANQIFTVMRAIVTPICIILFGFAGFQFLLGGQQGTEKARKTIFAAVLGLALVLLAPLFGQAVATWFANSATGSLDNYNPLA